METLEVRRKRLKDMYPYWKEMTLYQKLVEAEGKYSDRTMFLYDYKEASYYDIRQSADELAALLWARGIRKGDFVACALHNRIEFLYLTFALAKIGAVKVPINRSAAQSELIYMLKNTGAKLYITERVQDIEVDFSQTELKCLIVMSSENVKSDGILSWDLFFQKRKNEDDQKSDFHKSYFVPICEDAHMISDIIFTSGSTGCPKGTMLTHDMLLRSAFANCLNRGFEDGRKLYVPLPLFHVYGYVEGLLSVLFVGGMVLTTKGRFDPQHALEVMEKNEIQDILCVPSIMMKILQFPDLKRYSLKSLYAAYCSASVCPKWIWKGIKRRLKVKEIVTGYGMSEVSGASMQTDPQDNIRLLSEKVGKVLPGFLEDNKTIGPVAEYRIVDPDTGAECEQGEIGELICRGSIVTKGYYRLDERECCFTEDGWLKTGDIGCFDKQGYLKFVGRCNDMYKINGENVSPQFVDKVIAKCPDVLVVETVGVPDEKLGWIGVAFIEPEAGKEIESVRETLTSYCNETLASYQIPKYYFFLKGKEWPYTSTGKIPKYKLREMAKSMIKKQTK